MKRWVYAAGGLVVACAVWGEEARTDEAVAGSEIVASAAGVEDLAGRLAELDGSDAMAYFELAEEVAYEYGGEEARALSRRLFVLAEWLDRVAREEGRAGAHPPLAASVCIALAELERGVGERRWLLALASSHGAVDRGRGVAGGRRGTDDAAFVLAEAIGRVRSGDPVRARAALGRVDASALLREAGVAVDAADLLLAEVRREVSTPPLHARHSDGRVVRRLEESGPVVEIDPVTGGNPGPSFPAMTLLAHLAAEARLLGAEPDSFAAGLIIDGGQTLHELSVDELGPTYGVDVSETVWRPAAGAAWPGGEWSAPSAPATSPGTPPGTSPETSAGTAGG